VISIKKINETRYEEDLIMQITIASGKGGTGKTTLSVALASYLAEKNNTVHLLDCDVEEPNSNLFLKYDINEKESVYTAIPKVDESLCTGCGKCGDICAFSAIVMIREKPLVFPDMCHSCKGCILVCPEKAISESKKEIGIIERSTEKSPVYRGGRLNISEAMATPLIKAVKENIDNNHIIIIDSPPGTSCSVIEAAVGADFVILVTEPTPFGLHDLKLAVALVREIGIDFGVVINRSDMGDNRVLNYCDENQIEILASIPDSRVVAENYSRGEFVDHFIQNYGSELEKIIKFITFKQQKKAPSYV